MKRILRWLSRSIGEHIEVTVDKDRGSPVIFIEVRVAGVKVYHKSHSIY